MIQCKICNSKMVLRLSSKEQFEDKYFWGCSTFPECRNILNTILEKKEFRTYYLGNDDANSMSTLKPSDIVTDATRHFAICKQFNYDHTFCYTDMTNIDLLLGFEKKNDFYFWIATQQSIVTHGVHNHLPVGSPYYFTFKNLTDFINQSFDNVINDISTQQQSQIETSITVWAEFFRRKSEASLVRQKVSEEKIQEEHNVAVKKKADKATIDIFNAIRRKDLKAIESLLRRGADLIFKNQDGITCIEYARTFNDERLIEALTNNLSE